MSTALISDFPDPEAVVRLLGRIGFSGSYSLARLAGGANNQVYRVDAPQPVAVLKSYFLHPGDGRDRCGAEWAFASAAWHSGVRCIPEPLACDPEHRLSLFEYIPGRRLAPQEVTRDRVREALTFFLLLNPPRQNDGLRSLPAASEACFRLRDHLHCLRQRIERLKASEPVGDAGHAAADFVTRTLGLLCTEILQRTTVAAAATGLNLDEELPLPERCASPSDFGFHNALLATNGTMKFFDFEYAGWDDPAKTVCDFLCQPELPVPPDCGDFLVDEITRRTEDPGRHRRRIELLMPVYRLKWCCIMLNDFLPAGNRRRRFAGSADEAERQWKQLEKARNAAEQVLSSPPLLRSATAVSVAAA
jgi:hypothetical protein